MKRWATSPAAALVALLLGCYAYFYQAGGWNQNSRFNLVRANVEDHSLYTDRFARNTGDDAIREVRKGEKHHYCDKAPGASWLATPSYAVMYWAAGSPKKPSVTWLAWAAWLSIVVAVSVPSAITAVFLARLARALGLGDTAAIAVALGWGLATMGFPYGTLFYGNQIAGGFLLIAFTLLVEIRRGAAATPLRLIAVGALIGYAGATEYPAAIIGLPVSLYGLYVIGLRRALGWAVAGGLVPLLALALYHWAAFGSPAKFPYDFSVWPNPSKGWFMGIGKPHFDVLRKLLFGSYRGLLYTTPWLALAVTGGTLLALRRENRLEVGVCVWSVVMFLWLNCSIPPWDGGWAAGPRYLVPMLPFAAMLAGGVLVPTSWQARDLGERAAQIGGALVLAVLLIYSSANMLAATAVKPEIPTNFKRPYEQFVWKSWRANKLAVSTQTIDMKGNPPNGPRQAWNLGMKMGLDGRSSLVPLALWSALCGAWLGWSVRRRRLNQA